MDQSAGNSFGPLLLYDEKFTHFKLSDEEKIRKALLKLIFVLRSAGLDDVTGILQYLLRTDIKVFETPNNYLLPRIVEYIQPRFHAESFRDFRFLGGGGFGTVFKAKHRIDGRNYAIKVISGIRSLVDLERASSEVGIMARLKHANVIQYVTSWLEYGCDLLTEEMSESNHRLADFHSSSSINSWHLPLKQLSSSSSCSTATSAEDAISAATVSSQRRSSPTFSLCTGSSSSSPDTSQVGMNHDLSHKQGRRQQQCVRPNLQLAAIQPRNRLHQQQQRRPRRLFVPRLFIQMELCSYNLAQWLHHRNEQLSNWSPSHGPQSDWLQTVPHSPARWLADQLACGVAYLHANNMMHRDLKPENVLISGPPLSSLSDQPCFCQPDPSAFPYQNVTSATTTDQPVKTSQCYHQLTVKICDFGLARILNRSHDLALPALPPTNGFRNSTRKEKPASFGSVDRKFRSSSSPLHAHPDDSKRRTCSHGSSPTTRPTSLSQGIPVSSPVAVVSPSPHSSQILSGSCTNNVCSSHASPYLLTGHLGSELYAAPEVRPIANYKHRLLYDYKADIYSMGVIFLQLFYPFSTLHELIVCLQSISNSHSTPSMDGGHRVRQPRRPSEHAASDSSPPRTELEAFPKGFILSWPKESRLVGRMLSFEPAQRPSAAQLQLFLSSTSELPHLIQKHTVASTAAAITPSTRPSSPAPVASGSTASDWVDENDDTSVQSRQQPCSSPRLVTTTNGTHRIVDWLLWRNRQLERELAEVRERLRRYEQQHSSPQP